MAYRFVSLNGGERDIHWLKLGAFAALTFLVVPTTVSVAWFWMTDHWSHEAWVAGMFLSTLIVIRSILRAFSIPERELNHIQANEDPSIQHQEDSVSAAS